MWVYGVEVVGAEEIRNESKRDKRIVLLMIDYIILNFLLLIEFIRLTL